MSQAYKEIDASWVEPFAALFWRIRVQSYLLAAALAVISILGVCLYNLATNATALVYVVAPDGQATAISNNEVTRSPTVAESTFVAKAFIELLFGFNSSTVHNDIAQAVGMCSAAMAKQLREELADAQFLESIRNRGIRSEIDVVSARVIEHERRHAQVRLSGNVRIYPIADYDGAPVETKPFDVTVVMSAVPRDAERRLNGLEIVRLVHNKPASETRKDGIE